MPTIGSTTKPTHYWWAFGISSINQQAEILSMPEGGRIVTLGQWLGGWNHTVRTRLCIWEVGGELLGQSDEFTVADEGNGGSGHVKLYTADLITPVDLEAGRDFMCGFARNPNDRHQVSGGSSGSGSHFDRQRGTWPGSMADAEGSSRRIGSYVAAYEQIAGAWVRRSGAWARAGSVARRQSGAWAEIDGAQIRRSGAWENAD